MTLQVKDASGNNVNLATGSGDGGTTPFKSPLADAVGAQADSAATSDTGTFSLLGFIKRLLSKLPALGPAAKAAAVPVTLSTDEPAVGIGGVYNASLPTLTNGQKGTAQLDASSRMLIAMGTQLDFANDGVKARLVSGVLDDGSGNALTVKSARGSSSSSGVNTAIAAVTGKKIRVLSYSLQAANANSAVVSATWKDDAGTPVTLSQTWDLGAREGVSKAHALAGFYFQTTSNQALILNLSGAQTVNWEVTYVEV